MHIAGNALKHTNNTLVSMDLNWNYNKEDTWNDNHLKFNIRKKKTTQKKTISLLCTTLLQI